VSFLEGRFSFSIGSSGVGGSWHCEEACRVSRGLNLLPFAESQGVLFRAYSPLCKTVEHRKGHVALWRGREGFRRSREGTTCHEGHLRRVIGLFVRRSWAFEEGSGSYLQSCGIDGSNCRPWGIWTSHVAICNC
jgi:hypothetical protein